MALRLVAHPGPRADEEVEVNGWRGRDVTREVKPLGPTFRDSQRVELAHSGVDRRAKIRWRRPGVQHALSRRNPNVVGRRAGLVEGRTQPVREEVDRQTIVGYGGPLVARVAPQLRHESGGPEGSIGGLLADIDVTTEIVWEGVSVEVQLGRATFFIFK